MDLAGPIRLWLVILLLAGSVCRAGEDSKPESRRRVLLLGQKPDGHPATTHEYLAGQALLAKLLTRSPGIQTILVQADSPWEEGPELLDGADGAVLFLAEGARWVSEDPKRLAAFQKLAARGGGLSCLHWGMGTRDAAPVANFTALFGACHGGPDRKYKVATLTARPSLTSHPVLAGLAPFTVRDEFYYSLKKPVEDARVLVTPLLQGSIDDADQMVAWAAQRRDDGRSFGFSGLHFHDNWKLPEYRRLVLQGILWTLKQPIPDEGLDVSVEPQDLKLPRPPN